MIDPTVKNSAKFAFFYLLSLVALVFMAMSVGMIIFQIINKNIIDIINQYSGNYSPIALKLAISALIISAPIFYFITWQIFKNLVAGILLKDSAIRRWLTYFILLVVSIVMISWLINAVNSFLGGELTIKFILKAITAILISAIIFSFYFYDIKREDVCKKNKIILAYFYCSLVIVVVVFVASLFFVESPTITRNRKLDNAILQRFDKLDGEIQNYYADKKKLPDNLEVLLAEQSYLIKDDLKDPTTNAVFKYKISGNNSYQLCANFRMSNKDKNIQDENMEYDNYKEKWSHEAGDQCLKQIIIKDIDSSVKIPPLEHQSNATNKVINN